MKSTSQETMHEEQASLEELRELSTIKEEMGYEVPFFIFTWAQWLEMQAHMLQGFTHFQRAVEGKQPQLAALIVLELQAIVTQMQKEVCYWIGDSRSS